MTLVTSWCLRKLSWVIDEIAFSLVEVGEQMLLSTQDDCCCCEELNCCHVGDAVTQSVSLIERLIRPAAKEVKMTLIAKRKRERESLISESLQLVQLVSSIQVQIYCWLDSCWGSEPMGHTVSAVAAVWVAHSLTQQQTNWLTGWMREGVCVNESEWVSERASKWTNAWSTWSTQSAVHRGIIHG